MPILTKLLKSKFLQVVITLVLIMLCYVSTSVQIVCLIYEEAIQILS